MRPLRCPFTIRLAGFTILTIALLVLWMTASLAQDQTPRTPQTPHYGLILAAPTDTLNPAPRDSTLPNRPLETIPAPLVTADVTIDVIGVISRTKITQVFVNPSDRWLEGVYVFPLPSEAAVDFLTMTSEGRLIVGEIQPRHIAKHTYEAAKQSGRRASLLEQERPNIFTASVAQIPPRGTIEISIAYQEALIPDAGTYSLRFPMVVGPRYIPGDSAKPGFQNIGWSPNTVEVPDAARITPPVLHPSTGKTNPVKLTVKLDTGTDITGITSPTHQIRTWRTDDTQDESGTTAMMVALSDAVVPSDRDFVLEWSPDIKEEPEVSLFREDRPDGTYLLAVVNPPRQQPQRTSRPREMIILLDRSGSMAGDSIVQARRAVTRSLQALAPTDRFNVFAFNDALQPLFPAARHADSRTLQDALRFTRRLEAEGGTEAYAALMAALDNSRDETRLRQVVFITDGAVGNEAALEALIKARLGDSRLFTVGIGSAPNSYLMRRAATIGRGTHTFIHTVTDVERQIDRLLRKLAAPVATDITVNFSGDHEQITMWPKVLPDLYWGEPVALTAKLNTPVSLNLTARVDGASWSAQLEPDTAIHTEGIAKAWARSKIEALEQSQLDGVDPETIKAAITQTGMNFGLVTKHTSLIAVDKTPVRAGEISVTTAPVPVTLPAGWQYEAVFGARGGTDSASRLRLGLCAIFFAATAALFARRRGWL